MDNPLKEWLDTTKIGQNVIILDQVESTNDYAKELLPKNIPDGTVIIAKTQSGGRGQQKNIWESPEGGLYYTCILNSAPSDKITFTTLTCGVACQEAIFELCNIQTNLKWTNDIYFNNKKLGGILLESRTKSSNISLIIGIGINVNTTIEQISPELGDISTSLINETSSQYNIYQLAAVISNKLEKYFDLYNSNNHKLIKSLWIKNSITLGKTIRFGAPDDQKEGLVIDINEQGALVVQSLDGNQYCLSNNQDIIYI